MKSINFGFLADIQISFHSILVITLLQTARPLSLGDGIQGPDELNLDLILRFGEFFVENDLGVNGNSDREKGT